MSGTRNVAVVVLFLGVVFFFATQRSKFTIELTTVVKAKPEACVEYLKPEGDDFWKKFHPFLKSVEVLKSEVADDLEYRETNLYQTGPFLHFWEVDSVIHTRTTLDFENKLMTLNADFRAKDDFLGIRIKLVWEFLPHPEHPGWTLMKDTISNDFCYGMKFFIVRNQKRAHQELLQALQREVEQLDPK